VRFVVCSVAAAVLSLAAATVSGAAGHTTGTSCADFRVATIPRGGDVVLSSKIVGLRTTGVACKTAHVIAKEVALAQLKGKRIPARIDGFRIRVVKPCAGCTPRWRVSASGTNGSFKFVILGGA